MSRINKSEDEIVIPISIFLENWQEKHKKYIDY